SPLVPTRSGGASGRGWRQAAARRAIAAARLRGCERIPSRRRAADASRRAALLLLAIAPRLCLAYIFWGRLAQRAPRPPGSVRGFIHNLSALGLEHGDLRAAPDVDRAGEDQLHLDTARGLHRKQGHPGT